MTRSESDALIQLLGKPPIHCLYAIRDVLTKSHMKHAPANLEFGDLFVTINGLVYLAHTFCSYYGPIGRSIGFLALGGVGGTAISVLDAKNLLAAKEVAANCRQDCKGMSIEARIELYGKAAIVIPKHIIRTINPDTDQGLLKIGFHADNLSNMPSGMSDLLLGVENPESIATYLNQWLSGEALDREDTEGCNLRLPALHELLSAIIDGTLSQIDSVRIFSAVMQNENYLNAFFQTLMKQKWERRKLAAINIRKHSEKLALQISEKLRDKLNTEAKERKGYGAALVVTLMIIVGCLYRPDLIGGIILVGPLTILFSGLALGSHLSIKRNDILRTILEGC